MSQVLAHPDGQLEPALLLAAQFGQAVQVGGRDDPGGAGVAQAARRGVWRGWLGVNVGGRRREVLLDGLPALGGNRFEQVLHAHQPHHSVEVGNEPEHGRERE